MTVPTRGWHRLILAAYLRRLNGRVSFDWQTEQFWLCHYHRHEFSYPKAARIYRRFGAIIDQYL